MKICFLGDAESIHVKRWCEFFRDKGDEVSIITFRDSRIEGVNVLNVGENIRIDSNGGNLTYLKKIFEIRNHIKKIKPDVVNAHYLTSYGLLGALSKQSPLITSTWGSDILVTPKKNAVYKYLTKFVLRKSNLVTSDSEFMSKEIIDLGKPEKNVITAPMGIDNKVFNKDGRSPYTKTILSLRTLSENSNIDIIIKAFKKLMETEKDVKLIIANDGSDRQKYIGLIDSLKLNDWIEFLGSVQRSEVLNLLKANTLYVSIPTSDSTSVTLLEAMACGMIPIVSKLPANLEWISDGVNGFTIKNLTVDELHSCLKKALDSFDNFNSFAEANNKIILDRALWEDNMNLIRNSYLKLI